MSTDNAAVSDAVHQVIFVRHAESVANTIGSLDCGVPGPPLSARGFEQLKGLVEALEAELDGRPVVAVWASTMTRAQQTAEPIAERWGVPLRVHASLREVNIGELHARVDEAAHLALADMFFRWQARGDLDRGLPGGERGHAVVGRLRRALGDLLSGHRHRDHGTGRKPGVVVAVSHSAILRVALPRICERLAPGYTLENQLPNIGRVVLDVLDHEVPRLSCRSWAGTPISATTAG